LGDRLDEQNEQDVRLIVKPWALHFTATLVIMHCCALLMMWGEARSDDVVRAHQKISNSAGGFTETLDYHDWFGCSIASLGDLDGDTVTDLAVGAMGDDQGGTGRGAVWILFLNSDGTVKAHQKISDSEGSFTGILDNGDHFGCSGASLGDLDDDTVTDLAVGAFEDDDGGDDCGAVWILFLNNDGTAKAHQKISSSEGGFAGNLDAEDRFGSSVASLGDLDGDSVCDIAVGATGDDDGGLDRGAVWILFLNGDGTVKAHQKISSSEGGFSGTLDGGDRFGCSVALLGNLDGDTGCDIALGAREDDDGGYGRGAVWVLFLNSDGTVKAHQKISSSEGGFSGTLDDGDHFGCSVASLGDLDGDTVADVGVGARCDDDGGTCRGAVWMLFLNSDGTVKAHQKISSSEGGFSGTLDDGDHFGCSVASLGDLDGDTVAEMALGATEDDDENPDCGASWLLFLEIPMSSIFPGGIGFSGVIQNEPNPFQSETVIRYSLATSGPVRLDICSVTGRVVNTLVRAHQASGHHAVTWSGLDNQWSRLPAGIYFSRLDVGGSYATRKIVYLK
jgi:hypothetical protein